MQRVRKLGTLALALSTCLATSTHLMAQASYNINVYPTLAPNVFGSPSFPGWESNSLSALQNSSTSQGDPTLPSYYSQIPNGANIFAWLVTDFNSWNNKANPGTVFGPAFAGEFGNRLYFNLHITTGPEVQFSISQLSFTATTSDPGNFLGYSITAGTFNYSNAFVGLNYGPNGVPGGGDDVYITTGPNTQLVNELFARGTGNAPVVLGSDPGATEQDKINNALNQLPANFIFNGEYSLENQGDPFATGSAFVVVGVPEPATIIMACVGGAGVLTVCFRKRRRYKKKAGATGAASIK